MKVPKGLLWLTRGVICMSVFCAYECWQELADGREGLAFYFAFLFAVNAHNSWRNVETILSYRRLP